MIKLGLVSFSDGRDRVHKSPVPYITKCANDIKNIMSETDNIQIIEAKEIYLMSNGG